MRRALTRLGLIAAGFATCVAMLTVAVWVAGNTAPGRGLIERLTYRLTAGQVKLQGLGGSFPAHLTLEALTLTDRHGVWLTADHVSADWSPVALLVRRIRVDRLQVARLHMERTPVGSGTPGAPVTIPHIDVGQFAVAVLEFGAPLTGTPTSVTAAGTVQLRSLTDAIADVTVHRLGGDGDYALRLRFDPRRMDAVLTVHEPADGPLENLASLPGLGPLSATLTLQGPHSGERVDAVIDAGSLHARVQGTVDLTQSSADLDYALDAAAMTPRPDLAWESIKLAGKWHGAWLAPNAEGHLDVAGLRVAGVARVPGLHAELAASGGRLSVRSVADGVEIPGPRPRLFADAPLRIDGTIALGTPGRPLDLTATHALFKLHADVETVAVDAGQRHAAIQITMPDVAPFAGFAGQDVHGSATIDVKLAQAPGADSVILNADLGLSGGSAVWARLLGARAVVQLSASLDGDRIGLQSVRIAGNGVTATASGSATRVAATASAGASIKDVKSRWQLEVADLHRLSGDLAGALTVSGQLAGAPASLLIDAEASSNLSVRGSPAGSVSAVVHARGVPTAPSVSILAHGTLDEAPLNLDASLERSGASEFKVLIRRADWKSAHLDGDLAADAELSQSRGQLRLQVARLEDLNRLLGASLSGSLDGSLGLKPARGHTEARLEVDGKNLVIGPVGGDVHLEAAGGPGAVAVQLRAQLPKFYGAPASVTGTATLDVDARQLHLANIDAVYRGETVRLLSPAELSFGRTVSLDDLKFGAGKAVLEIGGQLSPTLDVRASLLHVDAAVVDAFVPELFAGGTLEARARLEGNPSSPTGTLQLDASGVLFADDAATGLPALDVHAAAQLADDTATLRATLSAGTSSQLTASGTIPLNARGALDMKIGGKLDVGMANPLLEARGLHASGALTVNATVTGSSVAPQVGGGIELVEGTLRDYARGAYLSDINAQVIGTEGGLRIKSFTAKAASGSVTLAGTFGVLQHGMPLDLTIAAKNAQPIASNIITANLDADLHVSGTALERLDVAGTIHVNRATIGIPDSLPPDVAVLDVRRRGKNAPVAGDRQLVVGLKVALHAPGQIIVQGRGLDAELGGDIEISGTSDEPVATGVLNLRAGRGSFTIAGNRLSFTPDSNVSFNGAGLRKRIDPTLDFTATTNVSEYAITLQITGLADAPQFALHSSPDLSPDQIMSLLLFSEPAAQLSALQVAEVGAALATLTGVGGGGANPLTRLQRTLGLDRLTVGANTTTSATGAPETSGAAIAAGRYVTPRVYVEGKQSTTGTSQVQVDVDLTKHLKLQTRLGNGTATTQGTTPENDPGSAIGLSYQFEY